MKIKRQYMYFAPKIIDLPELFENAQWVRIFYSQYVSVAS